MYNRYIRNDHGVYTRISVDNTPPRSSSPAPPPDDEVNVGEGREQRENEQKRYVNQKSPQEERHEEEKRGSSSLPLGGFVERILGKFNLQDVDTGDILLLFLLFLLFEEKADEELLIALGLLLIL